MEVSGIVTNTTGELVESPSVGIIFFDADGVPIGAVHDNGLDALDDGQRTASTTTYLGTPPLSPADVASEVFASAQRDLSTATR